MVERILNTLDSLVLKVRPINKLIESALVFVAPKSQALAGCGGCHYNEPCECTYNPGNNRTYVKYLYYIEDRNGVCNTVCGQFYGAICEGNYPGYQC